MYTVGDKVVYGSMGVCTVTDIGLPDMPGASRECYVLRPHYVANSKVYAPVEGNHTTLRPLLTPQQAESLIDGIAGMEPFPLTGDRQEMMDTCRGAIKSGDSFMLAKLLKTLHEKKERLAAQRKNLSSVEKEYFDTAEKMLHGEIAATLHIPMDEVASYIALRLEKGQGSAS